MSQKGKLKKQMSIPGYKRQRDTVTKYDARTTMGSGMGGWWGGGL